MANDADMRAFGASEEVAGLPSLAPDRDSPRPSIWQGICGDDGEELAAVVGGDWWSVEPDVCRVVDGLRAEPYRTGRISALGNAVVPQIPEIIGRAIIKCTTL